jgi:hypothetical protein
MLGKCSTTEVQSVVNSKKKNPKALVLTVVSVLVLDIHSVLISLLSELGCSLLLPLLHNVGLEAPIM